MKIKHFWLLFMVSIIFVETKAQNKNLGFTKTLSKKINFEDTLDSSDKKIWENGPVNNREYYGSAIAGSIFGFGSGQAMQGRFYYKGSLFLGGELASLGLATIGSVIGCGAQYSPDQDSCQKKIRSYGFIAFGLFKIWDIFDLWYTRLKNNKRYKELEKKSKDFEFEQFGFAPNNKNGMSAGLTISF